MVSVFEQLEQYFNMFPQCKKAFSLAIGQPKTYVEAIHSHDKVVVALRDFFGPLPFRVTYTDLLDYVKHLEALQPTYLA